MSLLYHVNMYLEFLILACTIYILAPELVVIEATAEGIKKARETEVPE